MRSSCCTHTRCLAAVARQLCGSKIGLFYLPSPVQGDVIVWAGDLALKGRCHLTTPPKAGPGEGGEGGAGRREEECFNNLN